jgi:hypothetical protein
MTQQKPKTKYQPNSKKPVEKKYLINPRYKNTFWTIVFVVVLTIFFIVNNTKSVQESGAYPPNYNSAKGSIPKAIIDNRLNVIVKETDSVNI